MKNISIDSRHQVIHGSGMKKIICCFYCGSEIQPVGELPLPFAHNGFFMCKVCLNKHIENLKEQANGQEN